VLHDPQKRQQYDTFGFNGPGAGGGFGGFGTSMNMDDIFSMFGDIFGGHAGFGGFGGGRRGPQVQRGSDLRLKVRLSLDEIAHGVTKKFKVRKDLTCSHCQGSGAAPGSTSEQCPTCHGSGVITHTTQSIFGMMQTQGVCPTCNGEGTVIKNKCPHCHGTGIEKGEEVVEIKIPAGVAEGMIVNVPGKGNAGPHKGVNGDIQVFIEEEENDTFVRDDNNLIYNLLLDFPTAALGGEVEIPTIEGTKLKVKMEPGTQPGKTLRLRGKGLPAVQGYGRGNGDLVVNVSVYIPKELSREEKAAIEQFRQSDNFKGDAATKKSIFQKFKNYFS
jgi:molecular chaperone DnaJ